MLSKRSTTELHHQPNFLKLLSSLIRQKVHLDMWAEVSPVWPAVQLLHSTEMQAEATQTPREQGTENAPVNLIHEKQVRDLIWGYTA